MRSKVDLDGFKMLLERMARKEEDAVVSRDEVVGLSAEGAKWGFVGCREQVQRMLDLGGCS